MEQLDWRMWAAAGTAVAAVVGLLLSQWLRRPPDAEEMEHRRRAHINQVGRIAEGQLLEVLEVPAAAEEARGLALFKRRKKNGAANDHRKLVCYSYSISGVSYETAQDITSLEARARQHRLVPGQPASIKYDPANPSDSILLADDWSGLH